MRGRRRRSTTTTGVSATSSAVGSTSRSATRRSLSARGSATSCARSPTPLRACSSSSTTRGRSSATRSTRASSARSAGRSRTMLGRSFLSLFREDEDSDARLGVAAAFDGAEPTERISHWCTRDGGERVIAWTATPIVDGEGRSLALIVGVDATERQRRESELRSSEERLRAAIEASPVAIVEYALDDTITRWNPAAERIFGWTAEQVVGGNGEAPAAGPGSGARRALPPRSCRRGLHRRREHERVRSDGSIHQRRDLSGADPRRRRQRPQPHGPLRRHHASASATRRSCARRAPASSRPATTRGASSSETSTTARSSASSPSPSRSGSPRRRSRTDRTRP